MAQQLKALGALAEDTGSIPSTYMVVHNIPVTPVLSSDLWALNMHVQIQTGKTHKMKNM